jgi:hypothetical protein
VEAAVAQALPLAAEAVVAPRPAPSWRSQPRRC